MYCPHDHFPFTFKFRIYIADVTLTRTMESLISVRNCNMQIAFRQAGVTLGPHTCE